MEVGCGMAMIRRIAAMASTVLLVLALATPVIGGLDCSLQATVGGGSATEVETGEEVLIEGFGFPANADVDITYSVDATPIGSETVTADGTGFFETTVIPQPGEEGLWTVTATVPKQCTAETGSLVVAGPATPTPSPTPSPTPASTPIQSELPDVATGQPHGQDQLPLAGLFVLSAAVWVMRKRLARLLP